MNLRAFRRKYDLELIAAALETLTLGKCVWDPAIFAKPSFSHPGMPDYIYNIFVNKNIMSEDDCDILLNRMRELPKVEAAFSTENIEFEIEDAMSLKIANQIDLDSNFDLKTVKSFSITGAVGKSIPNRDRIAIDKMLDEIKDNYWDEYKSKLRRAYIITELYYGKVQITIDRDLEINFEGSLPKEQLKGSNKLKIGKNISYEFESSKVPFAMKLERIKQFNS